MEIKDYFFDSYAIIELIKGNPKYIKYNEKIVTITLFNLIEVVYSVLKDYGEERARETYNKFKECVYEIDEEILIEALKMKYKLRKNDLSYVDCIGYIFSKKRNMIFLTGDKEFEYLENVEFVK